MLFTAGSKSENVESDEEMEEERFALFKIKNFLLTDKQELILLSNCLGTASSVATFGVNNKTT